MTSLKRLVVNADDFGFTPDVNEGIVEAHIRGILSSATLMANGSAFSDAVRLAAGVPSLDVGCHLVLVGGQSLLPPYRPLPSSVPELLAAIVARQIRLYEEMAAQVGRILEAGIAPTHLDTHKHTHLAPPVLDAVARIAEDFEIPWVRRPFDFPMTAVRGAAPWLKRATSEGLQFLRARFQRVLSRHHCRTTDYFAGFQLTGHFRTAELVRLIQSLPEGVTEFMCHPGRCRDPLRSASTRLKESREAELEALIAPETRAALQECGVELVNYRVL
ncbi:MAG: ChbG/HpnK family deacetylase [Acidobacteria bacterium]|nr:ChbG/HpnK family deacetylase [Acidobacteriota bacterium]MBI3472649.1 ChbG/HpnK family deacetylase [Candidatus Solibacter usitatus]